MKNINHQFRKYSVVSLMILVCFFVQTGFAQSTKPDNSPLPVNLGVLNDKAKVLTKPQYPFLAIYNNIGGVVNVNVTVDEQGNVIKAEAISGDVSLREASVTAARQSKFDPFIIKGKAAKISGLLIFEFDAKNSSDTGKAINQMLKDEKETLKKDFARLSDEFNALNKIYAEKVNGLSKVEEDKSRSEGTYCQALLEVSETSKNIEIPLNKLVEMYKKGDVAKVATTQSLEQLKYIAEDWQYKVFFKLKLAVSNNIDIFRCREKRPERKVTLDDLVAAGKIDTSRRVIELLKNLGDMAGYFAAGNTFNALTTTSSPAEVCKAAHDFKFESDYIEEDLTEFAKIYQLDVPPEYADPENPQRAVQFSNPEITNRAEKTLGFYTKVFLPKKEAIKTISSKYGCK